MTRDAVIYLISNSTKTHGVYEAVQATEKKILCTVRSVGMNENYAAMSHGFRPEYVFKLTIAEEYNGERELKYKGNVYSIIRQHETDDFGLQLTVQRREE